MNKKIITFLSFIILVLSLINSYNKYTQKEINKNINNKIKPIEEILEENISINIPIIKDNCEIDECITNNFYNNIINYFKENNYEEINKHHYIYYKNASNLIKITLNEENIK